MLIVLALENAFPKATFYAAGTDSAVVENKRAPLEQR